MTDPMHEGRADSIHQHRNPTSRSLNNSSLAVSLNPIKRYQRSMFALQQALMFPQQCIDIATVSLELGEQLDFSPRFPIQWL
jgi:hypothetical protein